MPLEKLIATLRGNWVGQRGSRFYWTELQGLLAALTDPFLMVLLAAPVLVAAPRAAGPGTAAPLALILGLGYMVSAGLLAALGDAQVFAPWAAGWGATIIFAAIGITRLQNLEDG
jgi:lipopolysaccharide export LptBFGC system permease protein LptF